MGCLNGGAWGYAALYSFHQWWLAIIVALGMTLIVIHLDLYIASGLIGNKENTPHRPQDEDRDDASP
jgi:hypothetical protein